MVNINIKKGTDVKDGWDLLVEIEEDGESLEYQVHLSESDWLRLTGGTEGPSELVRRSFEFLVAREPKEAILRSFDLGEISNYFPDFEHEIKKP